MPTIIRIFESKEDAKEADFVREGIIRHPLMVRTSDEKVYLLLASPEELQLIEFLQEAAQKPEGHPMPLYARISGQSPGGPHTVKELWEPRYRTRLSVRNI